MKVDNQLCIFRANYDFCFSWSKILYKFGFYINVYVCRKRLDDLVWFFIYFYLLKDFKCKYFTIITVLSIESTNILNLKILHTTSLFKILNTRSSKLNYSIDKTIYMRFWQSISCLYMHNEAKNLKNIQISLKNFEVIWVDSINIKKFAKTIFK